MTGRALLTTKAAEHLAKLCGMLGSAHDGERANAARLADRFVRQLGLRWCDVIFVAPEWQHMAATCRDRIHLFDDRESNFVANISRARRMPTDRQLAWLTDIYERVRGVANAPPPELVIFVAPEWQHMAATCRDRIHLFDDRESNFVANISRARRMPTDRQLAWLTDIYERVRGVANAPPPELVIFVAPEWQHMAATCRDRIHLFDDRESNFVANISRARRMPTDRQLAWLTDIYERVRGVANAPPPELVEWYRRVAVPGAEDWTVIVAGNDVSIFSTRQRTTPKGAAVVDTALIEAPVADMKKAIKALQLGERRLGVVGVIVTTDQAATAKKLAKWLARVAREKGFNVIALSSLCTTAEALERQRECAQGKIIPDGFVSLSATEGGHA